MKLTRIFVGSTVLIVTSCPLFVLSHLTYDCRYDLITRIYRESDIVFPSISSLLWPLGPLDWWGYISPLAFAVGVGASLRTPIRIGVLWAILLFGIVQSSIILAAFLPYPMLYSVMGYPPPEPYPALPLAINITMLVAAVVYAAISTIRCVTDHNRLAGNGEQAGAYDGG